MPADPAEHSGTETGHGVVLVFGLRPEKLLDSEGRIDAFLEPPGQEQVGVLVEAVRSGLQAGGSVIAILPEWIGQEAVARAAMVRSMLDTHRFALYETALPPLAATVLASLASACAPHAPSTGVLVSLLPELEGELHVFTWLGSVTGLSAPAPTFWQHLASLTPGSAFGVSSFPEPAVHRLHGDGPGVPVPQLTRPSRLVVAPNAERADWIVGAVNPALGGLEVRRVEPTPGGPSFWGTSKLVEAVAYPLDTRALVGELVAQLDPWTCRWCRELVARSPCPLCGHRGRPARRRAASPAQG
jgi:hypothetical protein